MSKKSRPPQCTCGDRGVCGYCPSIATTASHEAKPDNHPAWHGHHPLNPDTNNSTSSKRAA